VGPDAGVSDPEPPAVTARMRVALASRSGER